MLVQWFADMFYKVLTTLLGWINLPNLPEDIINTLSEFLQLLGSGISLFLFFFPTSLISVGMPIVIIIVVFKYGYYFIMWILKKIPMAGIK